MYRLNLTDCGHEELYCKADQIVDAKDLMHDVDEAYCRALEQSFCKYMLDNARGHMTLYFLAVVNRAGMTYASAVKMSMARGSSRMTTVWAFLMVATDIVQWIWSEMWMARHRQRIHCACDMRFILIGGQ